MTFYSKYINSNENFKTSSVFYWPYNSKIIQKSNNHIIGIYKDPIMKEKIYLSNDGLKQNSILHKKQLVNNLVYNRFEKENKYVFPYNRFYDNRKLSNFVAYFATIDDNLFKHTIFPVTYFKKINNIFLNKQKKVTMHVQFKIKNNLKTNILEIKKRKNFNLCSWVKFKNKNYYLRTFFAKNGKIIKVYRHIFQQYVFTNAQFLLTFNWKRNLGKFVKLEFLLYKFLTDSFRLLNQSFAFLYNYYLYISYYRYLIKTLKTNIFKKPGFKRRRKFRLLRKHVVLRVYLRSKIKLKPTFMFLQKSALFFFMKNLGLYQNLTRFFLASKFENSLINRLSSKDDEYINFVFELQNLKNAKYTSIFTIYTFFSLYLLANSDNTFYNEGLQTYTREYYFLKYKFINNFIDKYLLINKPIMIVSIFWPMYYVFNSKFNNYLFLTRFNDVYLKTYCPIKLTQFGPLGYKSKAFIRNYLPFLAEPIKVFNIYVKSLKLNKELLPIFLKLKFRVLATLLRKLIIIKKSKKIFKKKKKNTKFHLKKMLNFLKK